MIICVSGAAGIVQACMEAFGLFFGAGALLVQLHAQCAAIVFMTTHAERLPFPSPALLPPKPAMIAWIVEVLAGRKASLPCSV